MNNELIERVARVLWDLSEAKVSRLQGMHPYKPDPWDSAPEFFKIAQRKEATAVLAELAGELENVRRYEWLRLHSVVWNDSIQYGPGFTQTQPEELDRQIDDGMGYSAALDDFCKKQKAIDEARG